MSARLRLLAPDTADLAELGALLARLRRSVPGVEVGTDPVPGSVTVRLTLGAADASPTDASPTHAPPTHASPTHASPTDASPTGEATARPLGPHPLLVEAVAARVTAALGSAHAETAKVARLLQEGRDYAFVEHAFLAGARPGIGEGVRRCLALGANRVVVAPYALLDPPFLTGVRAQVGPAVGVVVAEELGDGPQLAELVLSRYREVLDGDSRCSCAACAYRPTAVGHE